MFAQHVHCAVLVVSGVQNSNDKKQAKKTKNSNITICNVSDLCICSRL
jgi:hypothetical protein